MLYSVVVPVFNSAATLPELVSLLEGFFIERNYNFELVMVDDCSIDNSWLTLKKLASEKKHLKIFRLAKNYGQHSSTLCGIHKAKGDIIVTIDDDLQYPVQEIGKLIDEFNSSEKAIIFEYENVKPPEKIKYKRGQKQQALKMTKFGI